MDKNIHQAAAAGDLDSVRVYIESRGDVNIQDADGWTPLQIASYEGHVNLVNTLLRSGAAIDMQNKYGATPLQIAAQEGHLPVLETLISCGAEINKSAKDGATPLFIAAQKGHLPVLEKLLSCGADINKSMKTGATPLYISTQEGRLPVLEKLLSCGAEINKSEEYGATPLHIAAQKGHLPVLETLISCGAEINKSDKNGFTPLHAAGMEGHCATVELLLQFGADINKRNNALQTPKFRASREAAEIIQGYEDAMKKIPKEVKALGLQATSKFYKALQKDAAVSNVIRLMLVGHCGVGKTTIALNLLQKKTVKVDSTDGIEVYINQCFYNMESATWHTGGKYEKTLIGIKDLIRIDLVDFAGQLIFYTTHQTYLTVRGLYFLVFNLTMGLHGKVEEDDILQGDKSRQRSVIDYLEYWISTILTYATGQHDSFPRIILIGTHRDKVKDESDLQAIREGILKKFDQMVRSNQLVVRSDLFISAEPMTETTRSTIRNVILEQGMLYPEFGERVPRSWIALQEKLNKLKRKGCCIITMEDLKRQNSKLPSPLKEEEIDIFLRYLHSIGYILHFPSPSLRENIILDPKVVIDAMRSFITCKRFLKRRKTSEIYQRMRDTGYVQKEDILSMWREKEVSQYGDHLLAVMKKLDLLCEPTIYQGGQKIPSDNFVVPSMISTAAPDAPVIAVSEERQLRVVFSSEAILPPAIFHRLVCSCLALWTIYQRNFFQGLVVLCAGRQHVMEIKKEENQICITFSHLDTAKRPDVQLCFAIKQFLSETMNRILDIYSTSSKQPITCKGLDALTEYPHADISENKYDQACSKCPCNENPDEQLKDVHFMRIADKLQRVPLTVLCTAFLNDAFFDQEIENNCKGFRQDVKSFYVLLEWRRRQTGRSTLSELRNLFEEHLKDVDKHIICQAMKEEPCKVDNLNPVVSLSKVYPEFLHATSDRITYKYIHFGLELGVQLNDIERLRMDKNSTLEISRGILDQWCQDQKGDATVLQLARAFCRCGERDITWMNDEYKIQSVLQKEETTQSDSAKSKCKVS